MRWISSACVAFLRCVDVVATSPRMSSSFAYRSSLVSDWESSGSFIMSVRMKTRRGAASSGAIALTGLTGLVKSLVERRTESSNIEESPDFQHAGRNHAFNISTSRAGQASYLGRAGFTSVVVKQTRDLLQTVVGSHQIQQRSHRSVVLTV